jgi:probable phosphoglycerate mutase
VTCTRFLVLRHGETRWNVELRIQGHLDSPLTASGQAQARALAERLSGDPFDLLIASDLGRAMETARYIERVTGRPVHRDARLRERSFGVGEGLSYDAINDRYPGSFSRMGEVDVDYTVPGGETRREFNDRVIGAFESLAAEHGGRRIAVVTHGGVLAMLYRHIQGIPIATRNQVAIPNASFNLVACEEGRWRVEAWDDAGHLDIDARDEG